MAILQISKIQHRRGLQQDLPQLASAELGWSIDSRRLYIGNGSVTEGAPTEGITEVLTEFSILNFTAGFASNIAVLEVRVDNLDNRVTVLESGTITAQQMSLPGPGSGTIVAFTANNATITYTCTQGTSQRTGLIRASRLDSTATSSYDDEYTEKDTSDLILSVLANTSHMILNYSTITTTSFLYQLTHLS